MKESNFQSDFSAWAKSNLQTLPGSCAYELKLWKLDKSKSFPIASVKAHQIEGLRAAEEEGLYHKISDSPIFKGMRSRFTAQKPFDCFVLKGAKAYIVIWPYVAGQRKEDRRCWFVGLSEWLQLVLAKTKEGKKSIKIDDLRTWGVSQNIWLVDNPLDTVE